MLKLNLTGALNRAGVIYPFGFLVSNIGFCCSKASKYLHGKQKLYSLEDISILCEKLHCTPNDLFYWEESKGKTLPKQHPLLTQLPTKKKSTELLQLIQSCNRDQLREFVDLLNQTT